MPFDIKQLKDDPESMKRNIQVREANGDVDKVLTLYDEWTFEKQNLDELLRQKKIVANEHDVDAGRKLKEQIGLQDKKVTEIHTSMLNEANKFPNRTHPSTPTNGEPKLIREYGNKPNWAFTPRDHVQLGQDLKLFDFERAAEASGQKFYYLLNAAAMMEVALINWAMNEVSKRGFEAMTTPDVARLWAIEACGFQPRCSHSQIYSIENHDLALVGTAEIPLAARYAKSIVPIDDLPIKMVAYGHAFRTEIGATGLATKGLYRVHQFSKVELFSICEPSQSEAIFDELFQLQLDLFSQLGFHFRVLEMPSNDLGAPAFRKIDIEAWMPGRNDYGEISSLSNCTDYQSRRLNIRCPDKSSLKKSNMYCHTLNATACAIPRIIVAILENLQQSDGTVIIPPPLRSYMGGMEVIRPPTPKNSRV